MAVNLDKPTLLALMMDLDKDGDGIVTKEELKEPMKRLKRLSNDDYDQVWEKIDLNKDGTLQPNELAKYFGYSLEKGELEKVDHDISDDEILDRLRLADMAHQMKVEADAAAKLAVETATNSRRGSVRAGTYPGMRARAGSELRSIRMPTKIRLEEQDPDILFLQACELVAESTSRDHVKDVISSKDGLMRWRVEDEKGETPMHKLCRQQDTVEIARKALTLYPNSDKSKTDVNVADRSGKTPIFLAAQNALTAMVEFLLNHGADPEMENAVGWTVLHQAVSSNNIDVVTAILGHPRVVGKILVRHTDQDNRTALHQAAVIGADEAVVTLLLRNGADPMVLDNSGNTAYDLAKRSNASISVQRLLEVQTQKVAPGA